MSYEQKARAAASALRTSQIIEACTQCGGLAEHLPSCPTCATDLPRVRLETPALLEKAPKAGGELGEPLTLEQAKAVHVLRVLKEKGWNKTNTARALAIDRRTLYHLIERYELKEHRP